MKKNSTCNLHGDLLERFLLAVACCLLFIGGLLYYKKAKSRSNSEERIVLYGYSAVLFIRIIYTLFSYVRELFVPGELRGLVFYGDYSQIGFEFELFHDIAWGIGWISFIIFIFSFEYRIKKTKYIFTIMSIILDSFYFILPLGSPIEIVFHSLIFLYFGSVFVMIQFFYMKRSDMEFRVISSYFILGIQLMGWAALFTQVDVKEMNMLPLFLSPLFECLAAIFFIIPLLISPKNTSNPLNNWFFSALGILVFHISFTIFSIIYNFPIRTTVGLTIPFGIVLTYFILINLKTMKSSTTSIDSSKQESSPNILASFTKPQNITEEEVTISKEKKICLVCKSNILKMTYVCPECQTFYCEKCYNALIDLENMCWACDRVLDESKPVKLPKEEEKKVVIEDEATYKKVKEKQDGK